MLSKRESSSVAINYLYRSSALHSFFLHLKLSIHVNFTNPTTLISPSNLFHNYIQLSLECLHYIKFFSEVDTLFCYVTHTSFLSLVHSFILYYFHSLRILHILRTEYIKSITNLYYVLKVETSSSFNPTRLVLPFAASGILTLFNPFLSNLSNTSRFRPHIAQHGNGSQF